MTCNDCGREINDCDRNGCRDTRGTVFMSHEQLEYLMRVRGMYERGQISQREGEAMLRDKGIS